MNKINVKDQSLGLENFPLKIICFFLITILPLFPLASFFSAIFFLINSSTKTSKSVRICLAFIAAVASSLLVAATTVDIAEAQDARVYYEIYEHLHVYCALYL